MFRNKLPLIIGELHSKTDDALREAVDAVVDEAKGRVPVDSGKLRDAIHVEETEDGYSIVAGDNEAFYGHLVEFGTTHSAAHPFLLPAFEAERESILDAVSDALDDL